MSRIKTSLDHKRIRRLIWLVLAVFVLLGYSLQSVAGSVSYPMFMQPYGTVSLPPVILEEGNVTGASTIYTNSTSAKVNVTAPIWLSGWNNRVRITIDKNDVDNALSNFPVLVYLSSSSGRNNDDVTFVFDEVGSNSKKIAVTTSDGTTEGYVEIEKWDSTNEQAWLWVKVPSVSNTSDTALYLYYDNSHADNTAYVDDTNTGNSVNVWDNNFKMVQHMRDNTTSSIVDSTSNDNDGTKSGAGQPAAVTSGKMDGAQNFTGGDAAGGDYVDCGNAASLQITGYLTVEAWVTIAGSDGEYLGIGGKLDDTDQEGYALVRHTDNKFRFWVGDGTMASADSDTTYTDSDWHYVVGVVNNGNNYIYVDGTKQTDEDTTTLVDSGNYVHIGRQYDDYDQRYWEGLIDEFRISNTTRNAAWIKASYESERDDLLDFGQEEDYVDNNTSNVGSPTDRGTHSNFTAQQYGPDSIYDMLTEENMGEGGAIEDYVDNNTSDMDSSTDSGTHSNFENQKAKDSSYDTLTEDGGTKNWGQTSQLGTATNVGPYRYMGGTSPNFQDMTITKVHVYISTAGKIAIGVWTGGALDNPVGATKRTESYNVSVVVGWNEIDVPDYSWPANTVTWIGWTNDGTSEIVYSTSSGDSGDFQSARGRWSQTSPDPANASVSMPSTIGAGSFSGYWYSMYIEYDAPYQLDLEVQFTDVVDFLQTEKLCIYAGTLGAEDLNVDFWNGTGWENLATDLTANSWNNYTVSLTSTTFTVRFKDGTIVGDTATQDQWQIDASLLRVEGVGSKEDAVDQQSNVDGSADVGTHSNFTAQQYGPDSINDTLTEENTGVFSNSTLLDDGFEAVDWDANWDAIAHNWQEDNSIVHTGSASAFSDYGSSGYFTCEDLNASGASAIYVDFWYRLFNTETDDLVLYYYDGGVYDQIAQIGGGTEGTWLHYTEKITDNQYFIPNFRIRFDGGNDAFEDIWVDDVLIIKEFQSADNYELDLEVRWTALPYTLPNEELCIYAGTMGAEDIKVDVWNGSSWINVISDMNASDWNNVTITSYLTSSTFTIRFKGGTETGDTSEDTWQIDVALIHVWNEVDDNYELDLEVQWTSADYSQTNEELCIYAYEGNNTHSLDATGGYMIIGDGTPDWGSTTGTISFWVKMDTSVQGRFWGQDGNMETRWSGTNLILDWGGDVSMTSATSFSADTWYFVAIVWDENNDNLFLYVGDENNAPTLDSNSLSGTWTSTTPPPTENRFLNGHGANEPVDGHGDDLRYWNIARSLTEIQSDYNTELTGSETNLRSYFKLNNNFDDIGPDNNDGSGSASYSFSSDVSFGAPPTENIRVDVWNGTAWQNLFTDLTNGWNNVSVSSYLNSSTFTIRFRGDSETGDTTQDSWSIDATLLHVWTSEGTYDYVLKVVNQVADNWTVNLQVYESSNIGRLSSLNISFHDGTSSNQIGVSGGAITQSEGPSYNLAENATIYISITNLQATTAGTSYLYVHLKIQVPNSSTYSLYVITFEIT